MTLLERRQIRFSAPAICDAIAASPGAACALGLPARRPDGVAFRPQETTLDVQFGTGPEHRTAAIGLPPLAALLLAFCVRARLPLPRRAAKSARITHDAVLLELGLDMTIDRAALKPEASTFDGIVRQVDWGPGGTRSHQA